MTPCAVLTLGLALADPVGQGPAAANYVWDRWGIADGLPQHTATSIAQNREGTLIFGTFAGVVWFDGLEFTVGDAVRWPDLRDVRVTAIQVDARQRLWAGLQYDGVVAFDGDEQVALPRLDAGVVWALAEFDARIWAGCGRGLWVLDRGRWSRVGSDAAVFGLQVHQGRLFAGGTDGLMAVDRDGTITSLVQRPMVGLDLDSDGSDLWAAWATGMGVYNDDGWSSTPRPQGASVVATDGRGGVWEGRDTRLIHRSAAALKGALGGGPAASTTTWDLGSAFRDLFVSATGELWIGTDHGGLARLAYLPFLRLGRADGLPRRGASVILPHGDTVLVASGCGPLHWFDRDLGRFEAFDTDIDLGCPRALLAGDDGTVWVGHEHEVTRFAAGGRTEAWSVDAQVLSLYLAADTLWIGTDEGGYSLRGSGPPEHVEDLGHSAIPQIVAGPTGDLWFALEGGIAVRGPGGWSHLTREDGIPGGVVRAIHHADPQTTWVGTYGGGLARIDERGITRINQKHGLVDNVVSWIHATDDHLWLNGNRGLSRIPLRELEAVGQPGADPVQVWLLPTGEGNGGSSPAGAVDARGVLWLPTIDGVVAVDPATLPDPGGVSPPRILDIVAGRRPHPVGPVQVPVEQRDLTITFGVSVLDRPELVRYSTRLSPLEEAFAPTGGRRHAHYSELPPGSYTFEVQAVGANGIWSDPTSVAVEVPERIEEQLWFQVVLGLMAFVGIVGGSRWRTRAIHRHNEALREQIAFRRETEEALRLSEAHYRGLFHAAADGILVVSPAGRVIDANPTAEGLFGAGPGELQHRSLDQIVWSNPDRIQRIDGSTVPVRLGRQAFGDGLELISLRDLSQIRDLQGRLANAQHLEALGRLAGGLGHGYNNLLTALQIRAVELQAVVDDPGAVDAIDEILACAEQGTELTRQLLAFGRRQDLRPTVVDVVELVRGLEGTLRRLLIDRILLELSLPKPPLRVRVDPGQLELAIVSLTLNAIEVLPDGGIVRIRVEDPGDDTVVIAVHDNGPGIEEAVLPHIFDPFFSTKGTASTGLGLASVHGFVRQSGGEVRVYTVVGEGTRFELCLKKVDGPLGGQPRRRSEGTAGQERLLLIDDDELVRRAVGRVLQNAGYEVHAHATGPDGLEVLAEQPIQLLITDVRMPSMDGVELAARARALQPDLRIVFMSGYAEDMLSDEIHEFVPKPFMPDQLLAVIRRVLDGP